MRKVTANDAFDVCCDISLDNQGVSFGIAMIAWVVRCVIKVPAKPQIDTNGSRFEHLWVLSSDAIQLFSPFHAVLSCMVCHVPPPLLPASLAVSLL